jgi:septal ring-binding cell division protein DamX
VQAPVSNSIGARTAAGSSLIATGSGARYSVQLMVTDARERAYLESYLAEAGRMVEPARLFLVPSGSPQTPRVGVLFGGFEARAQAAEALATLPEALRQFKPYVRSIESVRDEARRAQGS